MRKFIKYMFVVPIFIMATSCGGGERDTASSDVPDIVITNFNSRYPGAKEIKWTKEKKDGKPIFEAEFLINDARVEAEFDEAGTFIREEE